MSERGDRLRAAEAVCRAAQHFRAAWFIASVLDDGTQSERNMALWAERDAAERKMDEALDAWEQFQETRR